MDENQRAELVKLLEDAGIGRVMLQSLLRRPVTFGCDESCESGCSKCCSSGSANR